MIKTAELFLRTDDGKEISCKKVEGLDENGILVVKLNMRVRAEEIERLQYRLSNQFERKVIILDSIFGDILSIKGGG